MNALARDRGRPTVPETLVWALLALAGGVALLWAWRYLPADNDYGVEAAAPMGALLRGHLQTFLATAPSYGASLALRAPFALLGRWIGGNLLSVYRAGALPCVLALGALGVWLARELRARGGGLLAAALVVAVCVANPIVYRALVLGHPEEVLGAALSAGAVLLAQRGRSVWAGLALGLAIANKQWALLAIGPVVLALPAGRWRALLIAGVVAAALEAPFVFAVGSATAGTSRLIINGTGQLFHPWQFFWWLGTPIHWGAPVTASTPIGWRSPPSWLAGRAHLLIVWLAVPLTALAWWRRMRREDALLLLALLMLMRCALDPWDTVYYPLPMIVALVAWEASVARRLPLAALGATALTWLIFESLPTLVGPDAQALSFLVPAVVALGTLGRIVFRGRGAAQRAVAPSTVSRPRAALW